MADLTQRRYSNLPILPGETTVTPLPADSAHSSAPYDGTTGLNFNSSYTPSAPNFYGTDQFKANPNATFGAVGGTVSLYGRGTYTSAELTPTNYGNLGGSQGSGLPFAPYTIGASDPMKAEARQALYGDSAYYTSDPNLYSPGLDLDLQDIGRDLNMFASSPGSPNDMARLAGIQGVIDFYRTGDNPYGSEVRTGGAGNPNAGTTYPAKLLPGVAVDSQTGMAYSTTGKGFAIPKDWNKDQNGNPLPWGARREFDGKVYYSSSGASPALPKPTVYQVATTNMTVSFVPEFLPKLKTPVTYTSQTYHIS